MKIWKNTSTLDGFDDGLNITESKNEAEIAFIGSKPINLDEMPKLKGIFRAGIGRDNVPEKEAREKGILVKFPSNETLPESIRSLILVRLKLTSREVRYLSNLILLATTKCSTHLDITSRKHLFSL